MLMNNRPSDTGPSAAQAIQYGPLTLLEDDLSVDWFGRMIGEHEMPLVTVIIALCVVGVLLWLVNRIPMQSQIKGILNTVVLIVVVLWLLKVFGLYQYISQFRVGH